MFPTLSSLFDACMLALLSNEMASSEMSESSACTCHFFDFQNVIIMPHSHHQQLSFGHEPAGLRENADMMVVNFLPARQPK